MSSRESKSHVRDMEQSSYHDPALEVGLSIHEWSQLPGCPEASIIQPPALAGERRFHCPVPEILERLKGGETLRLNKGPCKMVPC